MKGYSTLINIAQQFKSFVIIDFNFKVNHIHLILIKSKL
jgi:REP element-mobilizing transposase RayT